MKQEKDRDREKDEKGLEFEPNEIIFSGKYQVLSVIGKGSFGVVYKVVNLADGKAPERALKVERISGSPKNMLRVEQEVLKQLQGIECFPSVYCLKRQGQFRYMELDLFDYSLEYLNQKFGWVDPGIAARVLERLVRALELLHRVGYIYRDMKPANVMISLELPKKYFLIDFGLCKKYLRDEQQHIQFKEGKGMTGTPIFASINMHRGFQASRRDDLISAFYTALSLIRPLPWQIRPYATRNLTTTQIFNLKSETKVA